MDFDNFLCKLKLRSCLFCFCVLFPTFVCWKLPKNSDQVENPPENLTSFTFSPHGGPAGDPSHRRYRHRTYIIMRIYNFLPPGSFLVTFKAQDLQVSTQSVQWRDTQIGMEVDRVRRPSAASFVFRTGNKRYAGLK